MLNSSAFVRQKKKIDDRQVLEGTTVRVPLLRHPPPPKINGTLVGVENKMENHSCCLPPLRVPGSNSKYVQSSNLKNQIEKYIRIRININADSDNNTVQSLMY